MLGTLREIENSDGFTFQEIGTVALAEGRVWIVRTPSGARQARRAISCLIEPEVEDRVLLAIDGDAVWILAVLDRRSGAPLSMEAEGDLSVRLRRGSFHVAAQNGIELATAGDTSLVSSGVKIDATEGSVRLERLSYLGKHLGIQLERIRLWAGTFDSFLDRLVQRVKRSHRFVAETDHLRAGQIDYTAEQNARLHAQNSIVTARQLIKIDGEQIHVG
jgi:hypothetical protein